MSVDFPSAGSAALIAWLRQDPDTEVSEGIAVTDFPPDQGGRGVIATRAIAKGELLFAISRARILTLEGTRLARQVGADYLREKFGEWFALILSLMVEVGDDTSPFRAYLDLLPRRFETPMFWTAGELRELQASSVLSRIGRADVDEQFFGVIQPWLDSHKELFSAADTSLEAFHRMGSIIQSYAFDIESETSLKSANPEVSGVDDNTASSDTGSAEEDVILSKAMIPLADMLNADPKKNNARLFHGTRLEMRATADIARDTQIWNTYGDLPDADLLRRYGYVRGAALNRDNVVDIPGDLVTESVQAYRGSQPLDSGQLLQRVDYLLDHGILDDFFEVEATRGIVPSEMLVAVEILLLSQPAFEELSTADDLTDGSKTQEVQDLILQILRSRLTQYATSLEDDAALLAASSQGTRLYNACQVRMGEKAILRHALDQVTSWKLVRAVREHSEEPARKKRR